MGRIVKRGLSFHARLGKERCMAPQRPPLTREERLAAKLRENLRRRKDQAREQVHGQAGGEAAQDGPRALPKDEASG